jgi:pimeloyl-ACP methyl ester carboxylesterase
MNTISTKDGVEIFYKDWGKGQPIVFSHGWPLSADDWDSPASPSRGDRRPAAPLANPRQP